MMQNESLTASAARSKVNLDILILGYLTSLILKGTLDSLYGKSVPEDKTLHELWHTVLQPNLLGLAVFLFALLRFMFGAHRFHEECRCPAVVLPFGIPYAWSHYSLDFI